MSSNPGDTGQTVCPYICPFIFLPVMFGEGGGLPRETGRVDRKEGVRWNALGEIVSPSNAGSPSWYNCKVTHIYILVYSEQADRQTQEKNWWENLSLKV